MSIISPILGMVIPIMGDEANIHPIAADFETLDTFAGKIVDNSADAFDETNTYNVGDLCIHNNILYKCTTAVTTQGEWNATNWTATSLGAEIVSRVATLSGQIATQAAQIANKVDTAGTGLTKSGTTLSISNSGVTAGSYGPSANATPGYGATFNVPYITVNAQGKVTAASTKTVKIPASDNTNTWRGIQNNLTSTSTTESLAAAQGKALNEKITTFSTVNPTAVSGIISSGSITVRKRAGVCFVFFNGVKFSSSGNNKQFYTGLPKCLLQSSIVFAGVDAANTASIGNAGDCCWIGTNDTVIRGHLGSTHGSAHYGCLIYPCEM